MGIDRYHGRRPLKGLVILIVGVLGGAPIAESACSSLKSGPMVYDVAGCGQLIPEQHFDLKKEKYAWIADLDAAGRKQFFDTYRGLFLKGKVVKSQVVEQGLSSEPGALGGQDILLFWATGSQSCGTVNGKRVSGTLREVCCDGTGDAPCLLGTGYMVDGAQVIGTAASGAGDATREKARQSKDYEAGLKAFQAKKWKEAAKAFERARNGDELDMQGHYFLGFALRELDQCADAVSPLKRVQEARETKKLWADEEAMARKAVLLLARCYSKLNQPGNAVLILNSYLLEPAKYKNEIKESLVNKDFGWIHTSKEYRDYKKEATKRLKAGK